MNQTQIIQNFGRNLRFTPQKICNPSSDRDLMEILNQNRTGKIRVMGSRHSWSDLIETDRTLIDLRHFNHIEVLEQNGKTHVKVGAGCQIKHLLKVLNQQNLTTPSVGLIAEQTIAGAIATGTHGSGKHSLSHYVTAVCIACFDQAGNPQIVEISDGIDLQAARCSLGCLGVVIEVTLPCIPQYFIQENATPCAAIAEALALEARSPLQQFFLMPHSWVYMVQERRIADEPCRSGQAGLYRLYWFLVLDLGLHLMIKLTASVLGSKSLIHGLLRSILPAFIFPKWVVVDRSDRTLIMKHELFHHLELEVFVRRSHVVEAASFITDILRLADDAEYSLPLVTQEKLKSVGLLESVDAIKGRFTHHYPICFRRILPDDTLISMASGGEENWYSISFITYVEPRDDFYALATFLAQSLWELFEARIHWGKWFPQTSDQVEKLYPRLGEFREVCQRYDPQGVFRNSFVVEKLGLLE